MDIFEKCYAPSLATELKEKGVYPYFHALESRQDVEVIMEGKRRIMLGSNNYLGLTTDPVVVEAGVKALEQYGTGCSGSRFLNGTLEMHLELEDALAKFLRKPGIVTFGTGFQSNVGIISALVGRHDYVICDRENHASIYAGCQLSYGKMLRYRHSDMAELEKCLQKVPETAGALIVTDGVFSMGGDIARLPEICALAEKYGARVMVDDAHGFGTMGPGGRGTAAHFDVVDGVDVLFNTFAKSMAGIGAFVCGPKWLINLLRYNMRSQLYAKSLPMPMVIGALKRLDMIRTHPEFQQKLWEITHELQRGLRENGFEIGVTNSPVTPVYMKGGIPEATNLIADLRENHALFCSIVVYPVIPKGEIILRVIPTAAHTLEDVRYTIEAFKAVRQKLEDGIYGKMPIPKMAEL